MYNGIGIISIFWKIYICLNIHGLDSVFDIKDVGIWIDPIDATSQYIKGGWEDVPEGDPPTKGLKVKF